MEVEGQGLGEGKTERGFGTGMVRDINCLGMFYMATDD